MLTLACGVVIAVLWITQPPSRPPRNPVTP